MRAGFDRFHFFVAEPAGVYGECMNFQPFFPRQPDSAIGGIETTAESEDDFVIRVIIL